MYKHILVATDGSDISASAVVQAVQLAKAIGAKLTGYYSAPQYMPPYFAEGALAGPGAMEAYMSQADWDRRVAKEAEGILAVVTREATAAGIPAATRFERNDFPYKSILAAAKQDGCDLIVMASHGRRGLESLLLGSETVKVLTHSAIPVLVIR